VHYTTDVGAARASIDAPAAEAVTTSVALVSAPETASAIIASLCVVFTAPGDDGPRSCIVLSSCQAAFMMPTVVATGDVPAGHEIVPRRAGAGNQAVWRCEERRQRIGAVRFHGLARAAGFSTREAAAVLDLPSRTLLHWRARFEADGLDERARGRPRRCATSGRRAAVTSFLAAHGPRLSLATLRAAHPDVTCTELRSLRSEFRARWRAAHLMERCALDWLDPGSVWAMDFSHPPHLIDGCFPAILNVRDLASRQQLLWLPVEHENAATVIDALTDLFTTHGAPLVVKCDNGPAFRADATKGLLRDWSIFALYSPAYCASYNGACERANRTLKELTEHLADGAGRPCFWTSDDLMAARLRANRLTRPWGAAGPTPEESWGNRRNLFLDERPIMWQHLKSGIAAERDKRGIDASAALPHYTQTEIERIVAQPVLEALGLLRVTRRRIAPVI
jgi:transposase InsO family protein